MPGSIKEHAYQTTIAIILFLLSATMLYPFLYVVIVSFTDQTAYVPGQLVLWPQRWSLDAYRVILSGHGFTDALGSSLFITLVGTPLAIAVSAMMAYMLAKPTLPGRKWILNLLVFTLLFSPGLIPLYLVIRSLGLIDSRWALILPGVANAWTLLVLKSFFQSLPKEVEESAKIDGSNDLGLFFRIVVPLSKAPLAAFTLFFAVYYWNLYFPAIMFINDVAKWPLQVFLQLMVMAASIEQFVDATAVSDIIGRQRMHPEMLKMAAVVVVTVPILLVYPFLQKHFAKGVLIGSVKG
ncbi:carbohydrate ABC transporter permease [Paenibacillus cymbidii]|uniref:carbohydrate ABC transporter permease n=1 Tax=Paenibacillus cymbidii TaxID=1639034 RepID=UPI001081F112|nr:carbohydrate ABC transporter permease [Paenibacillus cymbidii]